MHLTRGSVAVENEGQRIQWAGQGAGEEEEGEEGIDTPSVSVNWPRQALRRCQPERNT
jgi:hypothetical protein